MVSLADFQPRAETNVSHQQPMFHRRIYHSVKLHARAILLCDCFKYLLKKKSYNAKCRKQIVKFIWIAWKYGWNETRLMMKFFLRLHNFPQIQNLFSRVAMENCFWCYFRPQLERSPDNNWNQNFLYCTEVVSVVNNRNGILHFRVQPYIKTWFQ